MAESFEVAKSSSEDELSEQKRHEVVAAQLRGEAKAQGRDPDVVVASVAAELESIGLQPDPEELHRRYEEIDPDVPELVEAGEEAAPSEVPSSTRADAPADAPGPSPRASGGDGPVVAGTDAGRDHRPVDDADPAAR